MSSAGEAGTIMAGRYLYVLNGHAGEHVPAANPDQPVFEYQLFVETTGADVVSLSSLKVALRKLPLVIQRLRLGILVAARAGRYDAIVASGEDIGVFVALGLRLARRRTPLVMVTHGPQFRSPKFRAVLSAIKGMPNVVFACLSLSLAEWLIERHGLDPRRCQGTGYGIDTEFYWSEPTATERLIVSAGSSNRDYDTLLRAVGGTGIATAIAAHSTWVGEAAAVSAPVPDHVEIRSAGSYRNLRNLYRRARIVVVPTHDVDFAAGFAVIAEALASGTPVIATRGQVVSDLVIDGENGCLVPSGDVEALRRAITMLIDDPERAAAMGEAGAQLMRERYSLPEYVRRLKAAAALPT